MRDSWDGTRRYAWIILGGFLVITLALFGPWLGLMAGLDHQGFVAKILGSVFGTIFPVLETIYIVFAFLVYRLAEKQNDHEGAATLESSAV